MNSRRCFGSFLISLCLCVAVTPGHAQGKGGQDLAALVAAQAAGPQSVSARRAVENAVIAGLPDAFDARLLPSLPLDETPNPDGLGTLVVPKSFLAAGAVEPQNGQSFAKVAYLCQSDDHAILRQFCRVHYTLPDDAALAARIARLLALAHRTLVQKTGYLPASDATPFDVWLCRGGAAGGEQWGCNIYFYDLDAPRSSIEWIREVVHEYSHLALPPIGGYTAPEYWANGYLGERLIIRWLQRLPDGPAMVSRAWGDFSGAANFDRLLISPPLALYRKTGPSPRWLARRDETGMRYLIGQALSVDDDQGPRALGAVFAALPHAHTAKPSDWGLAVRQTRAHAALVRRP